MLLSSDDFFSMLIDDATLCIPPLAGDDAIGRKLFPAKKDVFGGLVSHLVVLWISMTYWLPQGHLISEMNNLIKITTKVNL